MSWSLSGSSVDGEMNVQLRSPDVISIGRDVDCRINLIQRQVSRHHAEMHWAQGFGHEQGHWRIRDLGSAAGTFLNGTKLARDREVRLYHSDKLEIGPWRFMVEGPASDRTLAEGSHTIVPSSEGADEFVALESVQERDKLARGLLVQLVAASEAIAVAEDETAVGQAAVDSLASATGYANVAFLREGADNQAIDIVAQTAAISGLSGEVQFSRSLLKRARNGIYVLRAGAVEGGTFAASIESLKIREAICVPVVAGSSFFGWLYLDNRSGRASESPEAEVGGFAQALARLSGLSLANIMRGRMQQRFDQEKKAMVDGTLEALIGTIDAKDPYTRGHSQRVSAFAALLGEAASLSQEQVSQLQICGLVHDIGKIGVPEEILRAPRRLSDDEIAQIQSHPQTGYDILAKIPAMRDILPGVLEHHERWDGSGYPNKLKGEQISEFGRIICLADCFDAMTSSRSYRPARTTFDVKAEIERCLGTHFDPELGEIFRQIPDSQLVPLIAPPIAQPRSSAL